MSNSPFRVVEENIQPDSRGCISFSAGSKAQTYRMLRNNLGQILFDPVADIPESERWLFENPEALAAVQQGIKESAEGKGDYIGSFSQYADVGIDQE